MQMDVMTRKVDIMPPIARISQIRRAARRQTGAQRGRHGRAGGRARGGRFTRIARRIGGRALFKRGDACKPAIPRTTKVVAHAARCATG
ncbi:hypothetical protein F9948_17610 [Burkholderia thailandensis]|nr:hypothetical protein [Burkholderia thailandensis]MDD1488712.1 hypothetical protein [Burkholderia thailandensis]MDD1494980.1 hypothetical protein [Burkholderia thailandensis]